ncbi:MAG: T9SS type A sorting domain-containing protein [Chitinophagales bacterium]
MKRVTGPNVASYNDMPTNKMLYGVQLYNTNGHQIGVANCNEEPNRFYNLYCGVYAQLSEIYAVHNSFEGLRDTVWGAPFYGCGIYANGNIGNTLVQRILIGDGTDCGKNYFYANRFGINLNNNDAGDTILISNNKFSHAAKADINVNSAKGLPLIDINYNLMDTGDLAGDGIRLLGCVNSGIYVHHNFIRSVPLSSTYTSANPFPKRVCGIVVVGRSNNVANRALKIYENTLKQAIYGIYSLNNRNPIIFNNSINNYQVFYKPSSYPSGPNVDSFMDAVGIMSTLDKEANIYANLLSTDQVSHFSAPNSLQNKVIGIAVNSSASNALVYCNNLNNEHWGILGLGTNTGGVDIRNNRLQNHQAGIAIWGTNASIGNQGNANCPTGSSTSPCTWGADSNSYVPDNSWYQCVNHLGVYNFDTFTNRQQVLMRDAAPNLPGGWTIGQLNPAMDGINYCSNPNALGSPLLQDFNNLQGNSRFKPRCTTVPNTSSSFNLNNCSIESSGTQDEQFKFKMAQLSWWEIIAKGEDSVSNIWLANDIHFWRKTELLQQLLLHPEFRDSSKLLDSFYVSNTGSNTMLELMAINEQAHQFNDTSLINGLISANNIIYPTNNQEINMQKLNSIYLGYFTNYLGTASMTDSMKTQLRNIASQCYITGGPSVFMARSLYYILNNEVDWKFNDDCLLSTGFFKTQAPLAKGNPESNNGFLIVYPNYLEQEGVLNINASEKGVIKLYDIVGSYVSEFSFSSGVSSIELKKLPVGIYLYQASLENHQLVNGKLIVK